MRLCAYGSCVLQNFSYVLLQRMESRRKEELQSLRSSIQKEEDLQIKAAERALKLKQQEDVRRAEEEALAAGNRPGSASQRRPGSASGRPSSAGQGRPGSAGKDRPQAEAADAPAEQKDEGGVEEAKPEAVADPEDEVRRLRNLRLAGLNEDISTIATGDHKSVAGPDDALVASFKYKATPEEVAAELARAQGRREAMDDGTSEISELPVRAVEDDIASKLVVSSLEIGTAKFDPSAAFDPDIDSVCADVAAAAVFCGLAKVDINELDAEKIGVGFTRTNQSLRHAEIDIGKINVEENELRKLAKSKGFSHLADNTLGPEFLSGNKPSAHVPDEKDDSWLTKSFFLSLDQHTVDSLRRGTERPLLPILEVHGLSTVEARKLNLFGAEEKVLYIPSSPAHDLMSFAYTFRASAMLPSRLKCEAPWTSCTRCGRSASCLARSSEDSCATRPSIRRSSRETPSRAQS
jgi:hypothetical protein